jgi:hypothetical protein
VAETKPMTLKEAEERIAKLEAEKALLAEEKALATEGFDRHHLTQWRENKSKVRNPLKPDTFLNSREEGDRRATEKELGEGAKYLTQAEFNAIDKDWKRRGMPGPNDLRSRAAIREYDARTGEEIGADPRLAPRKVEPARVGTVVDKTQEPA